MIKSFLTSLPFSFHIFVCTDGLLLLRWGSPLLLLFHSQVGPGFIASEPEPHVELPSFACRVRLPDQEALALERVAFRSILGSQPPQAQMKALSFFSHARALFQTPHQLQLEVSAT